MQENFFKKISFLLASWRSMMKVKGSGHPDPNPVPLVRGMDPRIRMHTKMSWIRNTGYCKSNTATSPQCLSCCREGAECACAAPGRQDGQVQAPLDCHPRAHLFSLPRSLRIKIQVTPSGNFITEKSSFLCWCLILQTGCGAHLSSAWAWADHLLRVQSAPPPTRWISVKPVALFSRKLFANI